MRNMIRAFLLIGILPLAGAALAQGVAQPGYLKSDISGFHGTQDTLIDAIRTIEQATGGTVTEIRFSNTKGMPGYHAAVAKGRRIEFIHIQEHSANVVQIDATSGPVWMLKWRGRSDVHFAKNAKVTLSAAIHTAELSRNGASAVAAGIARSASNPTSDVHAYNVILDIDGSAYRVAVDDSNDEVIADPGALAGL
jgi:uncharacterized membrane protein YkoI